MTLYAHCYRTGEITISRSGDEPGMLCLGSGTGKEFRDRVTVRARMACDNKTLLVPGLPEAGSEAEAIAAVNRFVDFLNRDRLQ
jgi:hypothetical protein